MASIVTASCVAGISRRRIDTRRRLRELLKSNLEFHEQNSNHATHDFHAFPAKFPPQLPRVFINELTLPGENVLDPMMGSGTTLVESIAAERVAVGFDIDPLAVLISKVKTTPLTAVRALQKGQEVADNAKRSLGLSRPTLQRQIENSFDEDTRQFLDYWFSNDTQIELMALKLEIEKVKDPALRRFLQLSFSAVIITKSGGVSLAWDLAHTRPHKHRQGKSKSYRPAIQDFVRRISRNAAGLDSFPRNKCDALARAGNAEQLPLPDESVDLLFTSPPYASNAIDYMRASKFSLVWFGFDIPGLSLLRSRYIGGESTREFEMELLPPRTSALVERITIKSKKRGLALRRYYSEMTRVLRETNRILKPDRAAVFVVGSAIMGGIDSEAHHCLGEIGSGIGLDLVEIGVRRLDRNRRMMPVTATASTKSQIENRMHEEYIVGFYKSTN
jgi:DNA modification methylase